MTSLTREQLYEKVWKTPAARLKKDFGISDVAIAKMCKRLNIPKPPRGYWAKLKYGHQIPRPPLPPPEGDAPSQVTIRRPIWRATQTTIKSKPVKRPLLMPPEAFTLPKDFRSVHPIIKNTREAFNARKKERYSTGTYSRIYSNAPDILDIRVGVESVDRALKIMEALIRGLETKGLSVVVKTNPQSWRPRDSKSTQVSGFKQPVQIHLEEPSNQVKHVPTAEEARRGYYNKIDYTPSGKLRLVIDEYCGEGLRKQWSVHDDESLGETLSSFVNGLEDMSKALQVREIEHERQKREYEEQQRRQYEEQARLNTLKTNAEKWDEAQQLRRFLIALKAAVARKQGRIGHRSRLGIWLAWADRYVDALDPMPGLIGELEQGQEQDS
jgi:hypothetical protein